MTALLKQTESDFIQFGSKRIHYSVVRAERRTLAISVHPNLTVVVTAPLLTTAEAIQAKVRKRAPWIIKQYVYFSDFLPGKHLKQFVSGATIYYLGKQYRLKVTKGREQKVTLKGRYVHVALCKDQSTGLVKELINGWYRARAIDYFERRIDYWWPKVTKRTGLAPKLVVKQMVKRWGSFTRNKRIILNTELIETPSQCIDYVIVHELCHAQHQNHSRSFFKLLAGIMPDWQRRKTRLETFGL